MIMPILTAFYSEAFSALFAAAGTADSPSVDPATTAASQAPQLADEPGWVISTVTVMLSIAFLFAVVRTLRGPSLPDRVVSLDLLAYFIIGAIGVYAIRTDKPSLIMIAIVMGLILFLGTTAFALYLERRARP